MFALLIFTLSNAYANDAIVIKKPYHEESGRPFALGVDGNMICEYLGYSHEVPGSEKPQKSFQVDLELHGGNGIGVFSKEKLAIVLHSNGKIRLTDWKVKIVGEIECYK